MFKLWTILGFEQTKMHREIFFFGIDRNYIPKNTHFNFNDSIIIKSKEFSIRLPESKNSIDIDSKYKNNDWELFRLRRRIYENPLNLQTTYIYRDDVPTLQKEMSGKELPTDLLLTEAAYFESVLCFRYLYINGAMPNSETTTSACCSGNEEIMQILIERSTSFTKDCLDNAIIHWNNSLAKWIIEERDIKTTLHSSACTGNFSMILYLLEKDADVNSKDKANFYIFTKCLRFTL